MNKRDHLLKLLRENVLIVRFLKKNGEERDMLCTLASHLLPAPPETDKPEVRRKTSDHVINAYDLEKNGWRSFIVDRVTSYEISDVPL